MSKYFTRLAGAAQKSYNILISFIILHGMLYAKLNFQVITNYEKEEKMKRKVFVFIVTLSLVLGLNSVATATHLVDHHVGEAIDQIDYIFNSGGGTFDGNLSPTTSLDWFIFAANAGDTVTIETISPISNFDTGLSLVVDTIDGLPEVGDIIGSDLTWIAENDDFNGLLSFINYSFSNSGIYAIAIGGYGGATGDYTVSLNGNTADVAPVPEPSTFILLGAGLAGLVAWRRKRS